MAFPQDPLDIEVSFKFDGTNWTDQSAFVYSRDENGGIEITPGRTDWASRVDPARCTFQLDNRDGRFSPRNPLGPYYGQIGRNTPVRVSVLTGDRYLSVPGGGGDQASTPDAAALDITGDIDVRIDAELINWVSSPEDPFDWVELIAKYTATTNRSWALAIRNGLAFFDWSEDGTAVKEAFSTVQPVPDSNGRLALRVTLDVNNGAGGHTVTFYTASTMDGPWVQLGAPVTNTGVTSIFNSTASLLIGDATNFIVTEPIGKIHKAEVRNGINGTAVANPDFTVQTVGAASFTDAAGRTWTMNGNTEITNRKVRFVGEVPAWPLDQDTSGNDVYVEIEAAGILRRMKANQSGLQSTLRRRIPTFSPLAYWPMEEGEEAERATSPVTGVSPLTLEPARWADNDTLIASEALPTVDSSGSGAQMSGTIPAPTATLTEWGIHWMYRLDVINTSHFTFMRVLSTGNVREFYLQWRNDQTRVLGVDEDGVTVFEDFFATGTDLYQQWVEVEFEVFQDGGNVDYTITWRDVGGDAGAASGTYVGTIGRPTRVASPPGGYASALDGMAIGHISAWESTNDGDIAYQNAVTAWRGETVFDRLNRVMEEEGLPITIIASDADTMLVGEQRAQQLYEILQDAADVDGGILHEHREDLRLSYRGRTTLYDQEPRLVLDYGALGHLQPGLKPVDDDQLTANDVTVTRTSAGSYRVEETEGTMSVSEHPDGVGRYPQEVTLKLYRDEDARDQAGWKVHLGTVDEARFPVINVWLQHAPALTADVLDLVIGDRIQIENPPGKFQYDTIDVHVQGYREFINQYRWEFSFNTTPASPWNAAYVGTDDAAADEERFSWVDTDGTILSTAHNSTTTTLTLAAPTEIPWTSDPFDSPYLLTVGGETIRVDAPSDLANTNPFFDTTTTGWTAQNSTIARSTAVVHPHPEAVASMLVTPNGVSSFGGATRTATPAASIVPGARYVASMWVYAPVGIDQTYPLVDWFNSGGGFISSSTTPGGFTIPAARWTYIEATYTAPAAADNAILAVRHEGTPASSEAYHVWGVRLSRVKASEVYDEFGRTATDTWGSADSNAVWTNTGGAAADYDVLSGYGRHINPATSAGHHSTDGGGRGTVDLYCDIATAALSTGASQFAGVLARYTDVDNLYEARVEFTTTNTIILSVRKRVASVETQLGTFTTALTNVAGTFVRVRFKLNGTDLKAKIWDVAGREPDGWPIIVSDSSLSSGQTGVKSVRNAGNTNANAEFRFDNFDMINRQEFVVTRSWNGVVKSHSLGADVRLRHPAIVAL